MIGAPCSAYLVWRACPRGKQAQRLSLVCGGHPTKPPAAPPRRDHAAMRGRTGPPALVPEPAAAAVNNSQAQLCPCPPADGGDCGGEAPRIGAAAAHCRLQRQPALDLRPLRPGKRKQELETAQELVMGQRGPVRGRRGRGTEPTHPGPALQKHPERQRQQPRQVGPQRRMAAIRTARKRTKQ
jgi:hypothetical protein